jgi:hypothetical protein
LDGVDFFESGLNNISDIFFFDVSLGLNHLVFVDYNFLDFSF